MFDPPATNGTRRRANTQPVGGNLNFLSRNQWLGKPSRRAPGRAGRAKPHVRTRSRRPPMQRHRPLPPRSRPSPNPRNRTAVRALVREAADLYERSMTRPHRGPRQRHLASATAGGDRLLRSRPTPDATSPSRPTPDAVDAPNPRRRRPAVGFVPGRDGRPTSVMTSPAGSAEISTTARIRNGSTAPRIPHPADHFAATPVIDRFSHQDPMAGLTLYIRLDHHGFVTWMERDQVRTPNSGGSNGLAHDALGR